MVTVGGTETSSGPPPREPRSRASILAAVGLGAGLALGALFSGGAQPEDPSPDTVVPDPESSPTSTIPSTTTTDVVEPRLATLVPGLLDVVIASGFDLNGSQAVTLWEPADRLPMRVPRPWGDFTTDASASWLAVVTPARWVDGFTLWVGNPAHMEPVSTTVGGSPVWHAWRPGNLAWTEPTESGWVIVTAEFAPGRAATPTPVANLAESASLVAWWQPGFLVQTPDSLQLWDGTGTLIREVADVQAVTGVGRELVSVLDAAGEPFAYDTELNPLGPPAWGADCVRAVWSPGGVSAAALCGFGEEQRFEYWTDPFNTSEPLFVEPERDFTDLGFTTNGMPYVVWTDPIRPSSAILFFHPADASVHVLDHPGRLVAVTTTAG
ncbi:MAG: hypothetical protein R3246_04015 [Acidimicrobiia bacterium]|nr:hypothetical protein [Acidimicrobiia bacterium]